jgi:CDP-diglyceride synthetase
MARGSQASPAAPQAGRVKKTWLGLVVAIIVMMLICGIGWTVAYYTGHAASPRVLYDDCDAEDRAHHEPECGYRYKRKTVKKKPTPAPRRVNRPARSTVKTSSRH